MVVTGGFGFGGDVDGGPGSGTDRGGGGDEQDRDGDRRLIKWEDTVAKINLGIEPNDPLDYSPRLELHHLTMGTLGSHGCQLERER